MFKTVYAKLAFTFLSILLLITFVITYIITYASPVFLQELNQRLHADLAHNLVKETDLFSDSKVNEKDWNKIFMGLMLVNPSIEVYLIDKHGEILNYSAPPGAVKKTHISLAPIAGFIEKSASFPILGDDPRDASSQQKVFSVAPILTDGSLSGYLYVVLGGEIFDSVVDLLKTSYILQFVIGLTISALLASLFLGLFIFNTITKRLRFLNQLMDQFKKSDFAHPLNTPEKFDGRSVDEIDQLGTTFREMSERIIDQVKQLQHTDASRRELIANVSHDLRTPLASLQGYIETLHEKSAQLSEAEKTQYLDIAFKHSQRLGRLISELFELAMLDTQGTRLHFEPFPIGELVQDIAQKFELEAQKKKIHLIIELPTTPAFVSADIAMIERVLENLIENALRHTSAGGEIRLQLTQNEHQVIVHVEDTGQGISEADIPHIFERFYRVAKHRENDQQGTGLGLAISKRILQLHNSLIQVSSKVNQGTVFSFPLPIESTTK